jgi:hypothetical protein
LQCGISLLWLRGLYIVFWFRKVKNKPGGQDGEGMGLTDYGDLGGMDLGEATGLSWEYIYPEGFKSLLQYVNNRYLPLSFCASVRTQTCDHAAL